MNAPRTIQEIKQKIEYFCAYQERCHDEVVRKLRAMAVSSNEIDEIIVYLIENNFLNEERFACSFARGKHGIKFWGKNRIINELKLRNISQRNITTALLEMGADEYSATFEVLASRQWDIINEKNILKKRKKFCDYLLRKGFESPLIYTKLKELEASRYS
jgi:regulatory protein